MNYKKIFDSSFSTLTPLTTNEEIVRNVTERAGKMERKKKSNVKKKTMAIFAAVAVLMVGTIAAAAQSPEFQKFVYTTTGFVIDPDKVVEATPIPQYPIEGFSRIEDIGKPISEGSIKQVFPTEMYSVELKESAENQYEFEKIAYGNGQTMVLGDGFEFEENQCAKIKIDADFTAEYNTDQNGELVTVGYIHNNVAYEIFSGRTDGEMLSINFTADTAGKYRFYITNCCAGLQNYDKVSVQISK